MLKFFRRIRQKLIDEGNLKKYLIYALGEILLVMIGILLAVYINSLYGKNIKNETEISYLRDLNKALQDDVKLLSYMDSIATIRINSCKESINKLYKAKTIQDLLIVDSLFIIHYNYADFQPNKGVYDEMVNTGNFYSLQNKALQKRIGEYYIKTELWNSWMIANIKVSSDLYYDSNLLPYHILVKQNSTKFQNYSSIDTSWIGKLDSPTFMTLYQYYTVTQELCNVENGYFINRLMKRAKELINEIENELKNL
jgi:hypothetical protein